MSRLRLLAIALAPLAACGLEKAGTGEAASDGGGPDAEVDASVDASDASSSADGTLDASADLAVPDAPALDAGSDGDGSALGTIAHVANLGTKATGTSGLTALSIPVGTATTAGHAILGCVLVSSTNATDVTVHDSAGNTYATIATANDGSDSDLLVMFGAFGAAPLTSGSTIDLSFSSGDNAMAFAMEFSGVTARDQSMSAGAGSSCTTFDTGTLATTGAEELLMACMGDESGSPTWQGPGWTTANAATTAGDHLAVEYRVATPGTYSASGQCGGGTSGWMAILASLR